MRFARFLLTFCPALVIGLAAAPLWAESQAAEKAGLPPLDTRFFPGQIFWLAVSFAILYILMARFALPGVERTQKKRRAILTEELVAANAANEAAKKVIAEYEKLLADARIQAIAAEDISKMAQKSIDQQAAQQKILTKNMHEAEARIAAARDAALREVQKDVVEIASTVIEKITGMKVQAKA